MLPQSVIVPETNGSVTGRSAQSAANTLRDGIVHLTIDRLGEAQNNGHHPTSEESARLWEELIIEACEQVCGWQAEGWNSSPNHPSTRGGSE